MLPERPQKAAEAGNDIPGTRGVPHKLLNCSNLRENLPTSPINFPMTYFQADRAFILRRHSSPN
jgi:hypothetical protein